MGHFYMLGAHRQYHDRDVVWHRSETAKYFPTDKQLQVIGAMGLCGMDEIVTSVQPAYVQFTDGTYAQVPNRNVIVLENAPWSDIPVVTRRFVGNRYEPLQNWRLAEILEGLNEHWPVEGVMVLKEGEISIVQLKIDEFYPGGVEEEKHLSYLTVANDNIQGGIMYLRTDIRTVCWNTYSWSLAKAKDEKLRIAHSASTDDVLSFVAKLEELTVESQKEVTEQMNALFTRKIDKEEFASIVDAAFPPPKKTSRMAIAENPLAKDVGGEIGDQFFALVEKDKANVDWRTERQQNLRVAVGAAYNRFNDEHSYAANTAYAAFNSVTQTVNHSELYTGSQDKRFVSVMLGDKAKTQENAWNAAIDLL